MKILIADDENKVRRSLVSMLNELELGCEVREAENGYLLLEMLQQYSPDIAFVDIKMPKLSGLDSIREGRLLSPDTKWVILSGFSEFEYAQEAIELGVSKYLLKPVSLHLLERTIMELEQDKHLSYTDANKKFEHDVACLYNGVEDNSSKKLEKLVLNGMFNMALLCFDGKIGSAGYQQSKSAFLSDLTQSINSTISERLQIARLSLSENELALLCAHSSDAPAVEAFFSKMETAVCSTQCNCFCATFIRCAPLDSYTGIAPALNEARQLAEKRVLFGIGSCVDAEEISINEPAVLFEAARLVFKICQFYYDEKILHFNFYLTQFSELIARNSIVFNERIRLNICRYLHLCILPSSSGEEQLNVVLSQMRSYSRQQLAKQRDNTSYVKQVADFVRENYMHDIGLSTVADSVGLTPNYLGNIFYRKTGIKFVDFLTETRLTKAKEFLSTADLPISAISELVGYHSPRYFSKQFFKAEKMYPSEYRDKILDP